MSEPAYGELYLQAQDGIRAFISQAFTAEEIQNDTCRVLAVGDFQGDRRHCRWAPVEILSYGDCVRWLRRVDRASLQDLCSEPSSSRRPASPSLPSSVILCAPPIDGEAFFRLVDLVQARADVLTDTVDDLRALSDTGCWRSERSKTQAYGLFRRLEVETATWGRFGQDVETFRDLMVEAEAIRALAPPHLSPATDAPHDAGPTDPKAPSLGRDLERYAQMTFDPSPTGQKRLLPFNRTKYEGLLQVLDLAIQNRDAYLKQTTVMHLLSHPELLAKATSADWLQEEMGVPAAPRVYMKAAELALNAIMNEERHAQWSVMLEVSRGGGGSGPSRRPAPPSLEPPAPGRLTAEDCYITKLEAADYLDPLEFSCHPGEGPEPAFGLADPYVFTLQAAHNFLRLYPSDAGALFERGLTKDCRLHAPAAATEHLDLFLGGYLRWLDLSKSYITGSAAMSSALRPPTHFQPHEDYLRIYYPTEHTVFDDLPGYRAWVGGREWRAKEDAPFTLDRVEYDLERRRLRGCLRARASGREMPYSVEPGANVDIAIDASSVEEFDKIAHEHFRVVKARFPSAEMVRSDRMKLHAWRVTAGPLAAREPGFREVDLFPGSWASITRHHFGMARLAYTAAAAGEPQFFLTASCVEAARASRSPNSYLSVLGGGPDPCELFLKYMVRGFSFKRLTPELWGRLEAHMLAEERWRPPPAAGGQETDCGLHLFHRIHSPVFHGWGAFDVGALHTEVRAFGRDGGQAG